MPWTGLATHSSSEGNIRIKVLINAFSARQGGGQTYLNSLLDALSEETPVEVFVLVPDSPSTYWAVKHQQNKRPVAGGKPSRAGRLGEVWPAKIAATAGSRCPVLSRRHCWHHGAAELQDGYDVSKNMIPFDPVQRRRYTPWVTCACATGS